MTTPKPASAPPADALSVIATDARRLACAIGAPMLQRRNRADEVRWSDQLAEMANRIEALAASAQVRDAEPTMLDRFAERAVGPVPVVITDEMVDKWHRLDNELRKTRFYADEPAYEYDRERLRRWMEAIK